MELTPDQVHEGQFVFVKIPDPVRGVVLEVLGIGDMGKAVARLAEMPLSPRSFPSEDPYRDVRVRCVDGSLRLPTDEEKATWREESRNKKWVRVRFLDLDGEGIFSTVFVDDEDKRTQPSTANHQLLTADG